MMLKAALYFVATIFVGVGLYAFIEGVSVKTAGNLETVQEPVPVLVSEKSPLQFQKVGNNESYAITEKPADKISAKPCKDKSFWAQYSIWGDTDTVYTPAGKAVTAENSIQAAPQQKTDESIGCDVTDEGAASGK